MKKIILIIALCFISCNFKKPSDCPQSTFVIEAVYADGYTERFEYQAPSGTLFSLGNWSGNVNYIVGYDPCSRESLIVKKGVITRFRVPYQITKDN